MSLAFFLFLLLVFVGVWRVGSEILHHSDLSPPAAFCLPLLLSCREGISEPAMWQGSSPVGLSSGSQIQVLPMYSCQVEQEECSVLRPVGIGRLRDWECIHLLAVKELKHFALTLLSWLPVVAGI